MQLHLVDPTEIPNWNQLVLQNEKITPFHSAEWAKVLESTYGYTPIYLVDSLEKSPEVIIPLMEVKSITRKKRGVSLPFTDYCDLIYPDNLNPILNEIISLGELNNWQTFLIKMNGHELPETRCFESYYKHDIDLTLGEEQLWKNLKQATRTAINKGAKNELRIVEDNSLKALKEFYSLLTNSRKKFGVPPQPWKFFANIYEYIICKDQGSITTVQHDQKTIGALISLHFGTSVVFKYIGMNIDFRRLSPTNLLYWEMIKKFVNQGYKRLSYGRSELDNEGLRKFKLSWGTTETMLNYYKYDFSLQRFVTDSGTTVRSYIPYLKKLPTPALKLIGKVGYKYLG